jgi:hypothetical protein
MDKLFNPDFEPIKITLYQCTGCKQTSYLQAVIERHQESKCGDIGIARKQSYWSLKEHSARKSSKQAKMQFAEVGEDSESSVVCDTNKHTDIVDAEKPKEEPQVTEAPAKMDRAAMIKHLRWDLDDDDPLSQIPPGLLEGIQPVSIPLGNPEWRADKMRRGA